MSEKLFVVGVANVTAFDQDENIVFTGKTLLDSSLKTSLSKAEVRGGRGNALQMNYFHSSALELTITSAEWNLAYISAMVGSTYFTGKNIYTEESVTLVANAGTVTNTPLAVNDTVYGWAVLADGVTIERFVFDNGAKTFTLTNTGGTATDTVCIKYYYLDPAAKSVTIPSNIIPSVLRVVLDTQIASNTDSANIVGSLQIVVPSLVLAGTAEIAMKADGVSQTNLSGTALAYSPPANSGCTSSDVYAEVTQVRFNTHWYSDVVGISILGGDVTMTHPSSKTFAVRAIHADSSVSTPPVADLSFTSGTTGTGTIVLHTGVFSTVASGTTLIHAWITAKPEIDSNVTVTVS